jgi:hypothetical protein
MFPYERKDFKVSFIRNTGAKNMNGIANKLKDDKNS